MSSGEVAWLLNGGGTDGVWRQTIGTDTYPNFTGGIVYKHITHCGTGAVTYDNSAESVSAHDYGDDGICSRCNGYMPATSDTDGTWCVGNLGQLIWVANAVNGGQNTVNIKLTADIDASSVTNLGIGNESNPFGATFDGDGHSITIALEATAVYTAPFGYVNGATIKNLVVKGSIATKLKFAASIVGLSTGTTTLEKCLSYVTINTKTSGDGSHGGLVAHVSSGTMTINNCGFAGSITDGTGLRTNNCGGIVGWADSTTNISNSFVSINNKQLSDDGCCTFCRNASKASLTNCYYSWFIGEAQGTYRSTSQFASGEVAWLLNGGSADGVWRQTIGTDSTPNFSGETVYKTTPCESGYTNDESEKTKEHSAFNDRGFCKDCGGYQPAVLNESKNVYEISNAGQLYWFAALTNGTLNDGTAQNAAANAVLMNDIPVNSGVIVNGALASDTSGFRSWTPIGNYLENGEKNYAGTFDGNGHTISGLYAKTSVKHSGVFGCVIGNVQNLTVSDSYFESSADSVGGIVGWLEGTAEKCASVNCIIKGNEYVGGIAGILNDGNIINCYSNAALTASKQCGGIAGRAQRVSTIKNCHFAGENNCNSSKSGITTAGIGYESSTITVDNCYYDSKVNTNDGVIQSGNKGTLNVTKVEAKTTERFESGEVAYLLNGGTSDGVWRQTIGTDTCPNFTGGKVYKGYENCSESGACYANSVEELVVTKPNHPGFKNGFCTVCGDCQEPELEDGVYKIANTGNLLWFADKVNGGSTDISGKLMNDIDMTSTDYIGIGKDADHAFAGTFDGNNKTLKIALVSKEQYAAPFPYANGATIKNLTVTGTIKTTHKFAASIVGRIDSGSTTLENCLSFVDIDSTNYSGDGTHGGLIAVAGSGTTIVKNCGFAGSIVGENTTSCGGLVGWTDKSTKTDISNSYVAATFTLSGNSGNTFGRNPSYVLLTNCYYLNALSDAIGSGATQKTAEQFASGEVAWLLNGGSTDGGTLVWKQTIGTDKTPNFTSTQNVYPYTNCAGTTSYTNDSAKETGSHDYSNNGICVCGEYEACAGKGTAANPYLIKNAGNLYWFAAQRNSDSISSNVHVKVVSDITVNKNVLVDGELNGDGSNFIAWTPIKYFHGTFDGNGKKISGLYFNDPTMTHVGLFGTVKCYDYNDSNGVVCEAPAYVKNVILTDSYFCGKEFVGGIAGDNAAYIIGCVSSATVVGNEGYIGGIAGNNGIRSMFLGVRGWLENCANTGKVYGFGRTGGVAGYNEYQISDCYNTGSVTEINPNNLSFHTCLGGVVGYNTGAGSITNCYNTGTVTVHGEQQFSGGVVGDTSGTIENCFYLTGCATDSDGNVQNGVGNHASSGKTTADVEGQTTVKTAEQFASGEVAWLLNGGGTDGIWRQTLTGDTPDASPNFTGDIVYYDSTNEGYESAKVDFLAFDGYQVRMSSYNGLRSRFVVDLTKFESLKDAGLTVLEYGTLVSASSKLGEGELPTLTRGDDGTYAAQSFVQKVKVYTDGAGYTEKYTEMTDTEIVYYVTVINFDATTYDKEITLRGYAVVKDADGAEFVVYFDYPNEDYRSISLATLCTNMAAEGLIKEGECVSYDDVLKFKKSLESAE